MIVTVNDKVAFIQKAFGSGKLARNCKNIDVRCPICAPRDPSKRKLAIRIDDDRNHCWTCGWRAHTLVPLLQKCGAREALLEYVERFKPAMSESRRRCFFFDVEAMPVKLTLPAGFKLLALATGRDPDLLAVKRYVRERGLTEQDEWYFKLGVSSDPRWSRRVIVPSFDSMGELNYYVGRAVDGRRRPKYDNPDVDKLPVIFNEINVDWTQRLVICEGTFDMFRCGDNVVPLLGSDLNEESALFTALLVNHTPVAVALDEDMWETKTLKVARKLSEYDLDVVIVDTRPFGYPGNSTRSQFKEALENAKPFDWESAFHERLNRASRTSLSSP